MIDKAYSLAMLPISMKKIGYEAANSIEANLCFLILELFPYFFGATKVTAVGSYGFLELTETATAGDAFLAENASHINKVTIIVSGTNLDALNVQGAGWTQESGTDDEIVFAYSSEDDLTAVQIQAALAALAFSATEELDAVINLRVGNSFTGDLPEIGGVSMLFRDGTTWLLVEGKQLTWEDIELAEMTWDDFESLKK